MRSFAMNNTNKKLFALAVKCEHKAAEMYYAFTNMFSHVSEVSAFWSKMREDEILHAAVLNSTYDSLTKAQRLLPCDKNIFNIPKQILDFFKDDLNSCINNLDDAYEMAHEAEFS